MNKRDRRRVVLNDYKAAKGEQSLIEIETDHGVFTVLDPSLWPDNYKALGKADDEVAFVAAIMGGRERFDEFVAAGGSAMLVLSIIGDEQGVDPGESSASSNS